MSTKLKMFLVACFFSVLGMGQEGEFKEFKYQVDSSTELPYVVYQPKGIDTKVKRPLIVYLHGAISRTTTSSNPTESSKRSPMSKLAEEMGCYVLFPYGKKDIGWFNKVGVTMVLSEISEVKKQFNIDEDKVFLSGFSDGASGTFYFATTQSTPFAGFIALNGSIGVATNLGDSPVYLENINKKPLFVVNTKSDMLYPEKMVSPAIDKIREYHSYVIYKTPEGNHEMSYFPSLKNEIKEFIEGNKRQFLPEVSLETSDDFSAEFHWLKIVKLNTEHTPEQWHTPYSLKMINDKASFGIIPDTKYTGDSMRVAGFGKKSIAKEMGVEVGDLIVKMEDTVIKGPMSSFSYLASKKAGEKTSLTILRDGKEMILEGKFPDAYQYEVFTKKVPSGKIKAQYTKNLIDVKTSCVAQFEIDFEQLPLKKGTKINLVINGKKQVVVVKGKQIFSL